LYFVLFFTFEFDVEDFRSIELNFLPVYRPFIFEKKPLLFLFSQVTRDIGLCFFFTFEFDVGDFRSIELNFLPVYRPYVFEKKPLLFFLSLV
jgi:hypothetical protein